MNKDSLEMLRVQLMSLAENLSSASRNDSLNAVLEACADMIETVGQSTDFETMSKEELGLRGALCSDAEEKISALCGKTADRLQDQVLPEETVAANVQRLKNVQAEITEKDRETEKVNSKLSEAMSQLQNCRDTNARLTGKLNDLNGVISDLTDKNRNLTTRYNELQSSGDGYMAENERLQKIVDELQGQVNDHDRKTQSLEAEKKRLEESISSFPAEDKVLVEQLNKMREEIRILRNMKRECSQEIRDNAATEKRKLEEEVGSKRAELDGLNSSIQKLKTAGNQLDGEIHEIAETALTDIEKCLNALNARIPSEQKRIDDAQQKCDHILRIILKYQKKRELYASWWEQDQAILKAYEKMTGHDWTATDVFEERDRLDRNLHSQMESYDKLIKDCLQIATAQYLDVFAHLSTQ